MIYNLWFGFFCDLYDKVDENLRKHDSKFPTADHLKSVTYQGRSGNWGKPVEDIIGEGKDSDASDAIIKIVDKDDPRPVWIGIWGGPQEVAQAIWKVQQTRTPEELDKFLSKMRIFMIGLGSKTGQDGSGQWLLDNFPNLFMIVSQKTYGGMFAQKSPLGTHIFTFNECHLWQEQPRHTQSRELGWTV